MKKVIIALALCASATIGVAQVNYEVRNANSPEDFKSYDTQRIRKDFVMEKVFAPGEINFVYSMYDRLIVGGAQPSAAPLKLEAIAPLGTEHFLDNREMGIINIGGNGTVTVDGKAYELQYKEALYIGRGKYEISFSSADALKPAKFYINSAPAHATYPIKKVTMKEAKVIKAGSLEGSNDRVINQLITNGIVQTCQLQMGLTELKPGSVWNTMPPHTHLRRMEAYLYFSVPEDQMICHVMGEPQETRNIWLHNEQVVISPTWSIHCAAGTSNYAFIWGMGGENLDYGDVEVIDVKTLK